MYSGFKELKVTDKARALVKEIYLITNEKPFNKDFSFKDQIRRASISIISNIAEGKGRGSKKDFAKFLFIARGSCTEVQAQLLIAMGIGYIDNDKYAGLESQCEEIEKMLTGLTKHLIDYQS